MIGETWNEYIEDILSSTIDIFALLMIPDKYVPQISGKIALERAHTNGEFYWSGYEEATTFYLIIIIFLTFCFYSTIISFCLSLVVYLESKLWTTY